MKPENHLDNKKEENPFADMGFFKFWIVSTLFWFTFPASIAVAYITIGSVRTKQLFKALVHDFLQTLHSNILIWTNGEIHSVMV